MHVVSLTGVTTAHEGRTLFADVSFGLTTRDRVGVIGPNGSGKSTLLRIVAGVEQPDAGEVVWANAARVSYLPQQPVVDPAATVLEVACAHPDRGVRRHEAEALLDRLGLDPEWPVGTLSGGQRRRASLAQALLPASDLLVLDEPTNHLDVDVIDWLEDELRGRNAGLLLVTHDRYLLERLVTRMVEVEPRGTERSGEIHWHEGRYSDVLEARAEREEQRAKEDRRRRNLLRKEVAWLRRGPKARTSKPQFRLQQVRDLQAAAGAGEEPTTLQLGTGRRRLGSTVLELEGAAVAYDGRPVLRDVDLAVGPGERIGIVGPNGSGKTTLLRVLTGQLAPDAGTLRVGQTVEVGFYAQEATIPPVERSVLDTILEVGAYLPLANGERLPAERLAERFGFDARLQRASVARLSGGERRRLALLHTLVRAPNVLVLDEPTNDLDLDTLNLLEDHLDGFAGTLIVASHDRFLLDRLTDQLYAIEGTGVVGYLDWERYREAHAGEEDPRPGAAPSGTAEDNRRRQERHRRLRALEERLGKLTDQRDAFHAELAAVGADYERAAAIDADLRALEEELAAVEEEWLELSVE